jgi:hypothetical protein
MERIRCISINHRTAPVDIRERIRVDHTDLKDVVAGGVEAFALNTCNRTEVYWTVLDSEPVYRLLERVSPYEEDRIRGASEFLSGRDAVRHLFMVASGLDSLVLGEPQILGQMKDAYRDALASGTTDTILNKALHRAFRSAKRIRTETAIGSYSVSVASEAVELADHIFGDIGESIVLVVGAGHSGQAPEGQGSTAPAHREQNPRRRLPARRRPGRHRETFREPRRRAHDERHRHHLHGVRPSHHHQGNGRRCHEAQEEQANHHHRHRGAA